MNIEEIRSFALSLPDATEEPHFDLSSFRVRGKIYATITADERHLHVFVDEEARERVIAIDAANFEKLWWGSRVMGLRVHYKQANAAIVLELVYLAWRRKAAKRLVASFDANNLSV